MNSSSITSVVDTLVAMNVVNKEEAQSLYDKSMALLVDSFILPEVVKKAENRGGHLSDTFMKLMAKHGQEFVQDAPYTGNVLMEIALQRLSRGAVKHEDVSHLANLPMEYEDYSVDKDQYALMSKACWEFITKQLRFCLTSLKQEYCEHAKIILWDLLKNLNSDGTTNNSYMWMENLCGISSTEALNWVIEEVITTYGTDEVVKFYTQPNWREHKDFFADYFWFIDRDLFFSLIDLDKETYYKGFKRSLLKFFGFYNDATKEKILFEISEVKKQRGKQSENIVEISCS